MHKNGGLKLQKIQIYNIDKKKCYLSVVIPIYFLLHRYNVYVYSVYYSSSGTMAKATISVSMRAEGESTHRCAQAKDITEGATAPMSTSYWHLLKRCFGSPQCCNKWQIVPSNKWHEFWWAFSSLSQRIFCTSPTWWSTWVILKITKTV